MSVFSYFAQNFLLPALAGIVVAIVSVVLGGARWPLRRHLAITLPLVIVAVGVCWSVVRPDHPARPAEPVVLAGRIVDQSNQPLGRATITLSRDGKQYQSEENGNYRVDLTGRVRKSERITIRVTLSGYSPVDASVEVPTEDYIVQLRRL